MSVRDMSGTCLVTEDAPCCASTGLKDSQNIGRRAMPLKTHWGKWSSIGELRFIRTAPIVLPTLHGRSAMARPISGFRHELVVGLCPHLEDTDLRKHTTPRRATIARIDGRPRMSKGGTTSQDWTTSRTCASSLKEVALEDLPTASAAPFLTTS